MNGYTQIMISAVTVYLFIIVAIRLFGKKELAQLSVVDLVFILLISNAVQNAMVGSDSSLMGGLVAATSLFVVNALLKYLFYRFPSIGKIVQGEPIMLIYDGSLNIQNMRKASISDDELKAAVREHGVENIEDVDLAILEVDGNISILSNQYTHKTVRKRKTHKAINKSN